ncbi:hypothetical protein AURDEDRAFT_113691 [Auricularia subglabra TFB-10046 SS5]|nr:hypothetical protein AURDEDRAFT_113691 [Auricularia subglabra TFB-10046 SS5]
MHRITTLSLGRDELHILSSFSHPAPHLTTLTISGGLLSASSHPVGVSLAPFLGGQTPKLDTVTLENCSSIYWQTEYSGMQSVRNVRVSMTENLKQLGFPPIVSPLMSPPPEVIYNSLAMLFPNASSLSLSISAIRWKSEAAGVAVPPAWQAVPLHSTTAQWLAQLVGFEAQGYGTLTKYIHYISLAQKKTVTLCLQDRDAIGYTHSTGALSVCVPARAFFARTRINKGSLELVFASVDGKLKRCVRTPPRNTLAHLPGHLTWFAMPARGLLVAWWMDSSWLSSSFDVLPANTVFSELRVLVVEIVSSEYARAASPFTVAAGASSRSRVDCPNLRSVVLFKRDAASPAEREILPWTFFRRLADLIAVPAGAGLELRGVLLPHDEPPADTQRPVFPFSKVVTDETAGVHDMGADWFIDLQDAVARVAS